MDQSSFHDKNIDGKISENTHTRIKQAALSCFSEKGYAGTSIVAIARKAGVSPATIYLHFSGKQALFDALQRPDLDFPSSRGQKRRREIIQAAIDVFGEKGYDNASMDEVAEATGLSKAAIYGYFSGKENLLAAVIEEAPAFTAIEERMDDQLTHGGTQPLKQAELFLRRVASVYLRMFHDPARLNLMRIILTDAGRTPAVSAVFKKMAVKHGSGMMARRLAALGFGTEEELCRVMESFMGMLAGWVLLHRIYTPAQETLTTGAKGASALEHEEEEMIERSVRIFLYGLERHASQKNENS